ncbi:MAG: class I SAM-dependent RNA methyltransferase [Mycobacteriales bacterium]
MGESNWQGRELELTVGAVAHGGHCVARHDGRVVFVRHALPGERVRAVVTEDRGGSFCRADAVTVLDASPDRVQPPCPYAGPGRCGGCDWQHATPAAQRELKAAVVREQLARLAKLSVPVVVEELPGGPLRWRTRVQYAVDARGRVGLRRHRSHDVLPIDDCRIAAEAVVATGVTGTTWPGASALTVVAGHDGQTAVLEHRSSERQGKRTRRVLGRNRLREWAAGREWTVRASGFWQVHPAAAEALAAAVLAALEPRPTEVALDLYGGAGLFAGVLAPRLGHVTLVEADPDAAADATRNLTGLPAAVERGRVERVLDRLGFDRVDLVVLDPPRSGAGAAVTGRIAGLRPRAVAYVACDPAALARDLRTFADHGYALAGLRAFDLFPMTHHVECVAHLVRA